MGEQQRSSLLNLALIVGGLAAAALLFALVRGSLSPAAGTNAGPGMPPGEQLGAIIQVAVRNGCGVAGAASRTARYLRDRGFDVIEVGNYHSFDREQTVVLDRIGMPSLAREVAAALDLPKERVQTAVRATYTLDAVIILGADCQSLPPFSEN